MAATRANRWLLWTGPVFAVLFFAVVILLQGSTPGEKASAEKVMDFYNSHQTRTLISVFLTPAAAALLVLFFSTLRSIVRGRDGESGPGPTVLLAGAILWASGLLLDAVFQLTLLSSSDHNQAQIAQTANVLSEDSWMPFIAGIAVTLIGAGMTVLSTRVLPAWLGWVALVSGIISLLGPGGFLGFWMGPLWMLVAGVMLALRSDPAPATV